MHRGEASSDHLLGGYGRAAQGRVESGQISQSMSADVRVIGLAGWPCWRVDPPRLRFCAGTVSGEPMADVDEQRAVRLRRCTERVIEPAGPVVDGCAS